jgi:putative phosphoesterase
MKVGLISDIHSDLDGLQKALGLLDSHGVEQIICAGDMVEKGQSGDGVITLIRERGIPCVKGNHEYIAVHKQGEMHKRGSAEGLRHQPLSDETIAFIESVPDKRLFDWAGKRLLMAHGTPWSDFVFLYPTSRRATFERVAREARADQAEIVVVGHTHIPMQALVDGVWIFNPGSVSAAGSRSCAVLTLPECAFEVLHTDTGEAVKIDSLNF